VGGAVWEFFNLGMYKPSSVLLRAMESLLEQGNFGSGLKLQVASGDPYVFHDGVSLPYNCAEVAYQFVEGYG
jgi:hypothetical protein